MTRGLEVVVAATGKLYQIVFASGCMSCNHSVFVLLYRMYGFLSDNNG